MAGPAVGLWLFEHRSFEEIRASVIPWLETFCDPVETEASGDLAFRVREPAVLGLDPLKLAGAGMFFLSEDDCIPADDEDYSAFWLPPLQGLILDAGSSGQVNHLLLGHLALAFARRLDADDRLRRRPWIPHSPRSDEGNRGPEPSAGAGGIAPWHRQRSLLRHGRRRPLDPACRRRAVPQCLAAAPRLPPRQVRPQATSHLGMGRP